MEFVRTGIILNTENYDACVSFYKNLFALEILFQEIEDDFKLTCFDFHGAYLMVETGGGAIENGKTITQNPTKIRFNVSDIHQALETVTRYGINAKITKNTWGSCINIYDPDGNRVGIREEQTFSVQPAVI